MPHWDQKHISCLTDDNDENKKAKSTEKCPIKRKLKFGDYKNCLEATQTENELNHLNNFLRKNHKEFIKKQWIIIKITIKI